MSKRALRTSLATLVATATLVLAGFANAAFYSSSFDPPGPLSFTGLGLFQIDDACLLAADGVYNASACNLTLLSATVEVTDTDSSDTAHLDFVSVLPNSADMLDFLLIGGNLAGVNSDPIGWVFGSPATGTLAGIPWWIQWGYSTVDIDPVFLYVGNCDGDECFRDNKSAGTAENVTFTRVPEPATLALLAGALGIAGLMRRRTKS